MQLAGCSEDNGQGPGAYAPLRAQVHAHESEHPGRVAQDPDPQVAEHHGAGHARGHARHGHHEPTAQHAPDTKDFAGITVGPLFYYFNNVLSCTYLMNH